MGCLLHESAWLYWLRTQVPARHRERMGWKGLHRHHERTRRGDRREWLDRYDAVRRDRRQLWRVHDELDRRSHEPIQGGGDATLDLELHLRRRDARRRLRPQG